MLMNLSCQLFKFFIVLLKLIQVFLKKLMTDSKQTLDLFSSGELLKIVPEKGEHPAATFCVLNHKSLPEYEVNLLGRPELLPQEPGSTKKQWKLCGPSGTVNLRDGHTGWLFLLTRKVEQLPDCRFGDHLLVTVEDKHEKNKTFHSNIDPSDIQNGIKVKVLARSPTQSSTQKENLYKKRTAFRAWSIVDEESSETLTRSQNTITKICKRPKYDTYLKKKGISNAKD
jgi:hypothetical protein